MSTPLYATQQLALVLRDARIARGLSQRELAERTGVGQSRLARIEAGEVDLRTSTLVQLARALDLELVLTPRRVLPAVQSLTSSPKRRAEGVERRSVRGTPVRVLQQIRKRLIGLEGSHGASKEFLEAQSALRALIDVAPDLDLSTLDPLRGCVRWLALTQVNDARAQPLLAKTAARLQELRRAVSATARLEQAPEAQRAAYSLEDEVS